MATIFQTYLPSVGFTSELSDVCMKTDGELLNINVYINGSVEFSTTLFPFNGIVTLFDLRSVVEQYMRNNDCAMVSLQIETYYDNERIENLAASDIITLVYLDREFWGFSDVFLSERFLSILTAKRISRHVHEKLYYFANAGEENRLSYHITYIPAGKTTPVTGQFFLGTLKSESSELMFVDLRYEDLLYQVETLSPITGHKILACTIELGKRMFTLYFDDFNPDVTFIFKNCFNVYETIELNAITTAKTKVDRSVAIANGRNSFYDQTTEKYFEVQTASLQYDMAILIEQLFSSHLVRIVDYSYTELEVEDEYQQVLITDSTCEVSDNDEEINSVKFTWQYVEKRPHLPLNFYSDQPRGYFTDEYNQTFD